MARPTRPRQPPAPPVEQPPKVTGAPQRRRAARATDAAPARPARSVRPARTAAPTTTPTAKPTARTAVPAPRPRSGSGARARVADLAGARRARRWRPGRRSAVVLGAVLVVLVAAGWVLLASPWLRVEQVRTTGVERTDPAAVQRILAGVDGTPLARVDARSLSRRLTALPLVQSVDVSRSWPSTLVVAVHERQAVAAVPSTAGGVDLVDGDGNVLVHADTAPAGVPTLDVDVAKAGGAALQAAIAVNASLGDELRSKVASISATGQDAVTLRLTQGPTVVWGDAGRPERKAEVLVRMLADPTVAAAKAVDVSAPDAPAVTP